MISRRKWLEEHAKDAYVKQARQEGFVARAAYKLLEIEKKDHILAKAKVVVDLGAAPGSWLQVCRKIMGPKALLFGIDLLELQVDLAGIQFIQGDFREEVVQQQLHDMLEQCEVDLILSDIAQNMSGNKHIDQARFIQLVETVWAFVEKELCHGGHFVCKLFHGREIEDFLTLLKKSFNQVKIRKPLASRDRSPEFYVVAKGYKKLAE